MTVEKMDPRIARSRKQILEATTSLLFERGLGGTSIDEVSRLTGIAKTTIYRHWPTRADLLRDACSQIGTPIEIPLSGNLRADAHSYLKRLAKLLRTERWTAVLPSVIDAAERDREIAEMYSRLQESYSAPLAEIVRRGIKKKELPKTTDVHVLVAALTGPLFYRRWFSHEAVTDAFAKQIVDLLLPARRAR